MISRTIILIRSIPHGLNDLLIMDITLYLCLEMLLKIIGKRFINGVRISLVGDIMLGLEVCFGLKQKKMLIGLH